MLLLPPATAASELDELASSFGLNLTAFAMSSRLAPHGRARSHFPPILIRRQHHRPSRDDPVGDLQRTGRDPSRIGSLFTMFFS